MLALNRIRFNIVSFPYRLSVKDYSRCLSAVIGKDCFRATGFKSLGLIRGGRGLRCGACVAKFQALTRIRYIIGVKRGAYALIVWSSCTVLCQLADTSPALPLYWACTPNTLHVAQSQGYTLPPYTLSMTDPHPHNFGARCDIHPRVIPPHFLRMKKSLPNEQHNTNAMEAQT